MAFRISGVGGLGASSPTNKALSNYAQARLDNTVARAVAKHANAITVDGAQTYLWLRSNKGSICTCHKPAEKLQYNVPQIASSAASLELDADSNVLREDFTQFQLKARSSHYDAGLDYDLQLPTEIVQNIDQNFNIPLDSSPAKFNSLNMLENEVNDQQLATLLSEGAVVYGGDKTACGICFGTQRTHGYDLATGRRLILEASGETEFTLNNAIIDYEQHPARFTINSTGNVVWVVNLPSYTQNWLNFTIRNNLQPADPNLIIEFFYMNQWQPLTVMNLNSSEGSDRSNMQIRVRQNDTSDFAIANFTHVELIYSATQPLIMQMPSLSYMTNYELAEPLISTEFEILATIPNITRESVMQDTKYKYLWKITEINPKMTNSGQVFSLTGNARRVQSNEALYALRVIFDPLVTVNYRGLEMTEGGLPTDNVISSNAKLDDIKFTINSGD